MLQVKLMQKMKEDANKMKQMGLQHHRAVSQLRKEHRKHENQVRIVTAALSGLTPPSTGAGSR